MLCRFHVSLAICPLLVVACSGDPVVEEESAGGGGQGAGGELHGDASVGSGDEGGATSGAGREGGESAAGGSEDGGPIDTAVACATCIYEDCPDVLACAQDPVCGPGLACTVTQCTTPGDPPDLICVGECFGGDLPAAFAAVEALSCVVTSCGADCAALLPEGLP